MVVDDDMVVDDEMVVVTDDEMVVDDDMVVDDEMVVVTDDVQKLLTSHAIRHRLTVTQARRKKLRRGEA